MGIQINCVIINVSESGVDNPKVVFSAFNGLIPGKYSMKVEKLKKNRSNQQSRYYWGVVCQIVKDGLKHNGYDEINTPELAHECLKMLFLKKSMPNMETGEVIEFTGSTTDLSTVEFNEYIEKILKWAAEYLNVIIPLPGEQTDLFLQ